MSSPRDVCRQSRNLNSTVALCAYECIHWHIFQVNSNVFCYRRVTQVIVCHLYLVTSATNYHQWLDQGMCGMILDYFLKLTLQNNDTYSVYLLQVKLNFRLISSTSPSSEQILPLTQHHSFFLETYPLNLFGI